MSEYDIIADNSQQNLEKVPEIILKMCNLKMLYLQNNSITKLPKDFFVKLPKLCWLDLRNNQLSRIPESIAHHQFLENLLISDNKIEILPNELGTVPKLKILQLGNNPLLYPGPKIIAEGTRKTCAFLKSQYEREHHVKDETIETPEMRTESDLKEEEEEEIRVMVEDYSDILPAVPSMSSTLIVKGLSKKRENKVVHRLVRNHPSQKILLKSTYIDDDNKFVRAATQTSDYSIMSKETIRQNWMDKLKQLLEEQEKILQQERNLQALSTWRQKQQEPKQGTELMPPPYATYPEYDSILSRNELSNQIDKMLQRNKNPPKKEDIQKLINELMSQLKELDSSGGGTKTPRSEIQAAESQIMKIMDVHKKIIKLQETNATNSF